MGKRTHFPSRQQMDMRGGGIAIGGLIEKERKFAGERFGLARKRGDRQDRALEIKRGLAQHQGVGGALDTHQRKAALVAGLQPRLKLATRFFETSFHWSKNLTFTQRQYRRIAARRAGTR